MTKIILSSALILSPLFTQAAQLTCDYGFAGVSMGTIKVSVDGNNLPGEYADVSLFFAPTRQMPVTNRTPASDEFLNLVLSKDDPSNELLMIIKKPEGNTLKSTLHNPSAPIGAKEMQGVCVATTL